MAVEFPKNRRPPMMRGIGLKSPKSVNGANFDPHGSVLSTSVMTWASPVMRGVSWGLSGVTKDGTGSVLGSSVVTLYYSDTKQPISSVLSDTSTGAWSFNVGPNKSYYAVAYKQGSPDVAGTTVNTLSPVAS